MPAFSHDVLIRLPLVRNRRLRKRVLRARRNIYERLGSRRYSRTALHDLDRKLAAWLPDRPGIFVEAGANDGVTQSNTYYLERFRGWTGVLVEPIPELAAECRQQRPRSVVVNAALVPEGYEGKTVTMHYGDLYSVVAGHAGAPGAELAAGGESRIEVPARTLTSILEEAGIERIDFMSLDVEGLELDALAGLDLARFAPDLLLVEALSPHQHERLDAALRGRFGAGELVTPNDLLFRTAPRTDSPQP